LIRETGVYKNLLEIQNLSNSQTLSNSLK